MSCVLSTLSPLNSSVLCGVYSKPTRTAEIAYAGGSSGRVPSKRGGVYSALCHMCVSCFTTTSIQPFVAVSAG